MLKKDFLILIILLLFSNEVFALGLSPASIDLEFQPNLKQEFQFLVINSENFSFPVEVDIKGGLDDYIDFETQNIVLEPYEQKIFKFSITLPTNFDRPGNHTSDIVVAQTGLIGGFGGGVGVGAFVSVKAPIRVFVPFEGPYLSVAFEPRNAEAGEDVLFYIYMRGLGTDSVRNIKGNIEIFDPKNDKVGTLSFFEEILSVDAEKEITVFWDSDGQSAGVYNARLNIDYDGGAYESSGEFRLGSFFIDVLKLQKFVYKGEINSYDSVLMSVWNDVIKDAYAELQIDYMGDSLSFKSENFDMNAWENKTVRLFVDARNMEGGKYPARFSVFYGNESNVVSFDINVIKGGTLMIYILITLAIILVLLALIYFKKRLFFKNKKDKQK